MYILSYVVWFLVTSFHIFIQGDACRVMKSEGFLSSTGVLSVLVLFSTPTNLNKSFFFFSAACCLLEVSKLPYSLHSSHKTKIISLNYDGIFVLINSFVIPPEWLLIVIPPRFNPIAIPLHAIRLKSHHDVDQYHFVSLYVANLWQVLLFCNCRASTIPTT